ncbi:LOW QUALITY PROTEIN: probable galactinol--sucrose galactosyltransferase 2 [Herrania umbratica]|uniref:galactinol--sucrose galactosyltransferase n=1 Tax=Herrania umbratica TaxID=108875 RepID=A0A6J1AJ56_9ROSI|nr:LOW QUALITY PROTEIN: probable galactinol--sucrose galactosyltransferase 2 [Herrania umbratica]
MGSNEEIMVTAEPSIQDGSFMVRGRALFTDVPGNIMVTPVRDGSVFVGATATSSSSRHVFTLGVLQGHRLVCMFRFKIWWMISCFGTSGCDVPAETQMLLLEARKETNIQDTENTFYVLILPVLDGQFRTTLQGTPDNELEFCIESGDPDVQTTKITEPVFMNSGDNPLKLMRDSIKILEKHKGTFRHIENKQLPEHVDWFGWNTWNAFYTNVGPQGIIKGLESFSKGGRPPKFLTIDEGWQNLVPSYDEDRTKELARLLNFEENAKFKGSSLDKLGNNLRDFIKTIKQKYGLKYVYIWHASVGYWRGVLPESEVMKKYNPKIQAVVQSPGNLSHIICPTLDKIQEKGIGLIDPSKILNFYKDYNSYLASCGVDGVKVDVQNVLELLGAGYGGRVSLTRQYLGALEDSVMENFNANNLICSMSLNSDFIYSAKKAAAARATEDFMPNGLTFQTLHVAAAAFNSLILGDIVVPDWDMFYSDHFTAEFHGAARALSGSAVYVSDKPGSNNFDIIKKLVLPDGSILRARHAGRPTQDCLFNDPVTDGNSLLKIRNLNKLSGVIGVFNCQRAGVWPPVRGSIYKPVPGSGTPISGSVCAMDADSLEEVAGENWRGDCAVYAFFSESLKTMLRDTKFQVALEHLKCEVFTVSPIRVFGEYLRFAPIGLLDMYNSGGALEAMNYGNNQSECKIKVNMRGRGRFGAYSKTKPKSCAVNQNKENFIYNFKDGLLTLMLQGDCNTKEIVFFY